jgi:hypothetical protein
MNQSQILIAEMSDADGIQIVRQNAGGAWFRADDAWFHSINSRYFQT